MHAMSRGIESATRPAYGRRLSPSYNIFPMVQFDVSSGLANVGGNGSAASDQHQGSCCPAVSFSSGKIHTGQANVSQGRPMSARWPRSLPRKSRRGGTPQGQGTAAFCFRGWGWRQVPAVEYCISIPRFPQNPSSTPHRPPSRPSNVLYLYCVRA